MNLFTQLNVLLLLPMLPSPNKSASHDIAAKIAKSDVKHQYPQLYPLLHILPRGEEILYGKKLFHIQKNIYI